MVFMRNVCVVVVVVIMWIGNLSADSTEDVKVTVQYKKDVRLFCGEKEALNEELQNTNDVNQIVDEVEPDDDDHLWDGVKFYRRWTPTPAPTDQQTPQSDSPTSLVEIVSDQNNEKYSFAKEINILTIKSLRRPELESLYFCNSSTSNKTIFFHFQRMPFLYMPEHASYSLNEYEEIELTCKILYGLENNQKIKWDWKFELEIPPEDGAPNQKDLEQSENLSITMDSENGTETTTLKLKNVKKSQRGFYICIANNTFGSHSRKILLRVKNVYSVIWPSIGVIVELILVFIIVLACEKFRHKNNFTDRTE